ncbi:hypothetical protein HYFRA_00012660 [Hymenoscyphus fraxineus]|uniref:Uncharacterized protein n=1 Tax=Hymenoscyphus fraxineus TaxID=746836 RepID=A0A9N9L8C4_9HELO|nr:hypothetical protein HYFRA_00012660 [Hymenoscyphus fraxineus]
MNKKSSQQKQKPTTPTYGNLKPGDISLTLARTGALPTSLSPTKNKKASSSSQLAAGDAKKGTSEAAQSEKTKDEKRA